MREKNKVLIKPITGCIPGRLKGVCVCVYIFKVLIKLSVTAVSRKKKIVVTPDQEKCPKD